MRVKRTALLLAILLAGGAMISPLLAHGSAERVFEGEIGDSQCSFDVHSLTQSHQEMLAMGSAGKTPADCTRFCVKERGGRFVLQGKDKTYKLDNQALAEPFAGESVKVTGTLDEKTDEIHMTSIKPLGKQPHK